MTKGGDKVNDALGLVRRPRCSVASIRLATEADAAGLARDGQAMSPAQIQKAMFLMRMEAEPYS